MMTLVAEPANLRQRSREAGERIFQHFHSRIVGGELRAGDQLPSERAIAEEFAANRKTVRQALQRLADMGVIDRRQGSGSYVQAYAAISARSTEEIEVPAASPLDALEARKVFEPGLYRLVVARATGEDFERMREAIEHMRAAKDQTSFKKAGYEFHLQVARATRNPVLVGMYEMLVAARGKAGWGKLLQLNDRKELRDDQLAGLQNIFDALLARDADAAARVASINLERMIGIATNSPKDI